ncbi:hypothetical protein CANARDRAFT_200432, partial [[Candida] arabinofermentans NRRL YB-2248]
MVDSIPSLQHQSSNDLDSTSPESPETPISESSNNTTDSNLKNSSTNSLPSPINNTNNKTKKKSRGRIFQCSGYQNCSMSFTRSEHLARHIRKHTGERPFKCEHCSRRFSRLDNLRQHNQTVH